jgi:hypothetical protein
MLNKKNKEKNKEEIHLFSLQPFLHPKRTARILARERFEKLMPKTKKAKS